MKRKPRRRAKRKIWSNDLQIVPARTMGAGRLLHRAAIALQNTIALRVSRRGKKYAYRLYKDTGNSWHFDPPWQFGPVLSAQMPFDRWGRPVFPSRREHVYTLKEAVKRQKRSKGGYRRRGRIPADNKRPWKELDSKWRFISYEWNTAIAADFCPARPRIPKGGGLLKRKARG